MLKRFLYQHPILSVLIPYIPCLVVLGGLWYYKVLDPFYAGLLAVWLLPMLALPVSRMMRGLLSEATVKLERDCDPIAYLDDLAFLRRRRLLRFTHRVMLDVQYGLGLDAAGRYEEAYEWLDKCRPAAPRVHPLGQMQIALAHAVAASHCPAKRGELPAITAALEKQLAALQMPPMYTAAFRDSLDTLHDACHFYEGDLVGLRERYVARVEQFNAAPLYRRQLMQACIWLARIYEKEGSGKEALAMYQYVAERGNRLGVVEEAKGAIERLKR